MTHAIMAGHGPSNDFRAASDMGLSSSSSDDDERTTATNQEEETDGGGSLSRRSTLVRNKYDAKWDDAYRRLCAFRQRHGHTNISYRCKEDPMLGRWGALRIVWECNAMRKTWFLLYDCCQ